ncbi:MAG: DegT/DnrJ/EryC1/StrS family aminotransferase, partial [Candidatus Ratteibacteria bacterium]|nr:DegT/DnrJ/EryC1/StrS family aminotransferase [Candidatus Ratteibacteria bacterium]
HQYTVRLKRGIKREDFIKYLKKKGIESGIFYPCPIYRQPLYRKLGYGKLSLPNVERISREVVSLPVHPSLSKIDSKRIIDAVVGFRP